MGISVKKYDFDMIAIGGGVAGIAAAEAAAKAGAKVAIVEKGKIGGAAVNTRDIPYAAGLNFSHLYAEAIYGSRFGLSSDRLRFNYPTVSHWRERVVAREAAELKKELEDLKIECFRGRAHFVGPHEVAVGKEGRLTARKFLIATGVEQKDSGIIGLENVPYLTPDDALKVERPPKTVMIVGGGASGVEIAQYYAELGSKVAIAEIAERLLPKEDEEVGQVLEQYFTKRFDIKILASTRVIAVERDAISPKVIFLRNGQEKMVRVETIVVAAGTKPATDIGLENAGMRFSKNGSFKVDQMLQTPLKHIYAAGDVLQGDSSTEKAVYEAGIAVKNMFGRSKHYVNYSGFIRVTNTNPQIAVVGMTEDDLNKRARKYNSVVIPLSEVMASKTQDFRMGFIKMIAAKDGKILGATVMAPNATEVIQEIAVMIRHSFSVTQLASTPHVAMSWSDLVRIAAKELAK
ncbi:NAD(P)/FAD-dependent oxidoreductase [Candidatus Saccharibacteria bacterium]|nr:NAD(P)/FAD-dependent oxidoreductase [Candidatus Saccharibacteria bacterium]